MADIDRLSRRVPVLCKVAPSVADVHVEDVHRAGGIMGILGELDRAGLLNRDVAWSTPRRSSTRWRAMRHQARREQSRPREFFPAAPGGVPTPGRVQPGGALRGARRGPRRRASSATPSTPSRKDGGLAVLYGNLALDGCIVKTAGVDASILKFEGPAKVFESQDDAVHGILAGEVVAGDVVVIRYEGPRGGPGMQEMLYPTSYLKIEGPRQGLRADHRRPLLRRHLGPVDRPCLARGGRGRRDRPRRGGRPHRHRHSQPHDEAARVADEAWAGAAPRWRPRARTPGSRRSAQRKVSTALRAYAAFATSAARGAVREVPD